MEVIIAGFVIAGALGAGIGWGVSMLIWGEPHTELMSALSITLGVIGAVLLPFLSKGRF